MGFCIVSYIKEVDKSSTTKGAKELKLFVTLVINTCYFSRVFYYILLLILLLILYITINNKACKTIKIGIKVTSFVVMCNSDALITLIYHQINF